MNSTFVIAIACGLASALMYASLAGQSFIAFVLFMLAPLPLFIAGLGWGAYAAALAAATGGALISAVLGGWTAINFVLMTAAAPTVLSHLALLSRSPQPGEGEVSAWYPQGRLAAMATLLAATGAGATLAISGAHTPEFKATLLKFFDTAQFRDVFMQSGRLNEAEISAVFDLVADVFTPALAGAVLTAASLLCLWLAARIVARSGRLARPAPHLPSLQYPQFLRFAALASFAMTFAPGPAGFYALCFIGALTVAYFIVGMAVLWRLSRGASLQPFLMAAVLMSVPLLIWPAVLVALLGIADHIFNLRARISPPGSPPPTQP
ncbi:MAG: hypothetical protein SGJ17_08135 [Hyphomicrobiales bacterium]|nr:hypothetical protein [Hyphomicrobiales bacterium]